MRKTLIARLGVRAGVAVLVTGMLSACSSGSSGSSGPAKSSLGPFTISACKVGWVDGTNDGTFYTSRAAAQNAANAANASNYGATVAQASEFTIRLTATAVVSEFTVAYYDSSGSEIDTGYAYLPDGGTEELTAGQTARFMDTSGEAQGAASCQVIGSDSGNS